MVEGATGFCALFGSTTPFDEATLAALYPTPEDYLEAFRASARSSVDDGFILEVDADVMVAKAEIVAVSM